MTKKQPKRVERNLYKPIANFLKRQCGCDPDHLWSAGCGRDLSFAAGFGKRKPDVVGVSGQDPTKQVHLVEAKLLRLRTTAFEDTLAQLDSFRPYADYLWAAFPKESWEQEQDNQRRWEADLKKRGYGLLLVAERVTQQLQPAKNQEVDRTRWKTLLDAVLGEEEAPICLPSLGAEASRAAGRAAARLAEVMVGPVKQALGGRPTRRSLLAAEVHDSATALFTVGYYEQGHIFVQGDPFGWHLRDGRPVVWVFRYSSILASPGSSRTKVNRELLQDAYLYAAKKDNTDWICRPLADCDTASLRSKGYTEDVCLGRPLAISDRTLSGIKEQFSVLLAWARKLPK